MENILVTGGLGYIGSHTVLQLLEHKFNPILLDNLCNSSYKVLEKIEHISQSKLTFYNTDLSDKDALHKIFSTHKITAVIHFAGLKAVSESLSEPLKYYYNNIGCTLTLLNVMASFKVKKIVFSSSATIYCQSNIVPLIETAKLNTTNPYGRTKLMIEEMLADLCTHNSSWSVISLRYFNPVGAHKSGDLGDNPNGIPTNLAPVITNVIVGKIAKLNIFGSDYPTHDGTCIRDYIHVEDLADGHIRALEKLSPGFTAINLGSGRGYSVLEMLKTFEQVTNKKIPYELVARRSGDIETSLANISKAKHILNWVPTKDITEMCADAWHWQKKHPNGL